MCIRDRWDSAATGLCDFASLVTGFLDQFQTPYDGKVIFCHSSSGNSYTQIDTNNSSCLTHINHAYDIFPTTLCDT